MNGNVLMLGLVFITVCGLLSCDEHSATTVTADSSTYQDTFSTDTTGVNSTETEDTASTLPDTAETESASSIQMFCDDYYVFDVLEDYKVHNNVWGFESNDFTQYAQCVFLDEAKPGTFGWEWQLDGESEFPSYPRVEFGWNPWMDLPTNSELPRRISSLNTVEVRFEQQLSFEGRVNTSFDLWLSEGSVPTSDTIRAEVMIWLDATLDPPTPRVLENVNIQSILYDVHINTTWYAYPFIIFLQKSGTWTGQIDILAFLKYLIDNGHLTEQAYLADIEFGNEIWSGVGKMQLTDYAITIE